MARIIFRGLYAAFPMVGIVNGDLAYATDLLQLYEWSGVAWIAYWDYPDYQGGKSRVYTPAEWAAFEGTDINLFGFAVNVANGLFAQVLYAVPVGSTLYITYFTFAIWAPLVADADNNQIGQMRLLNTTTGVTYADIGGNGGAGLVLAKPIVVPGGDTVGGYAINRANHNCDLDIFVAGYVV